MRSLLFFVGGAVVAASVFAAAAADAPNKDARDPKKPAKADDKPPPPPSEVGGKSLDQWIKEIRDPDPCNRENAIRTVFLFGPDARKAVPSLVAALREQDQSLRLNACIALGEIRAGKEHVEAAVKGLTALLSDSQGVVRFQAAVSLGKLGPEAKAATSMLCTYTLRDGSSYAIRKAGAQALGLIAREEEKGPDTRVCTALLGALRDVSWQVRLEAVIALGRLGPPREDEDLLKLKKALEERLKKDTSKNVVIWCRVILSQLDKGLTETHVAAIARMLDAREPNVRSDAIRALGVLGQSAQGYVMNLIDMVKDKDSSVAATAAEVLVQFHRDKKGFVSQRHMELIARMLKDPDPQVRRHAASTLGAFGPEARSQVLALTEALQDEDTATVVYAITALWDIGPAAESAIPALTVVARNHKDEGVREAAEKALKALRPKVNNKK